LLPLLACGPGVKVDDVKAFCSSGSCRVVFYVEAREPQTEEIDFEVTVLAQKPGAMGTMVKVGSGRVRVRAVEGERLRVETTVQTGVQRGHKAVVNRLR
jgi:hypothetical protein